MEHPIPPREQPIALRNGSLTDELPAPPAPPTSWSLTEDEADIYQLLQDTDRHLMVLFQQSPEIMALRQRFERFLRRVETRLGLPAGDLTSGRYDLDAEAGAVRLRAPAE